MYIFLYCLTRLLALVAGDVLSLTGIENQHPTAYKPIGLPWTILSTFACGRTRRICSRVWLSPSVRLLEVHEPHPWGSIQFANLGTVSRRLQSIQSDRTLIRTSSCSSKISLWGQNRAFVSYKYLAPHQFNTSSTENLVFLFYIVRKIQIHPEATDSPKKYRAYS